MSESIEYFEVIGPGMDVIKRFRDRENAEDFANQERTRRMKSLDEEDNLTAIMLPVQRFKKASTSEVWADSRKMI